MKIINTSDCLYETLPEGATVGDLLNKSYELVKGPADGMVERRSFAKGVAMFNPVDDDEVLTSS